ncbi:anaerobic ribonucleoside-triphosphate reductase activating protein [Lachnospiraceae bacterium OttesenSCG-928-D06]|nr:anaerobic ribonucleoside-triphosphate reductase activating protein [Lachnospiraceae bacterium OttesenSCG-928-D06]
MKIYGLNKTTLLDYPGHVAATVFTGGCNFRCPYCHNSTLVTGTLAEPVITEDEFFAFLKKRRGILQGVCITGGEPTLQKGLIEFIEEIKKIGYLVKLDTNGYRPDVLWNLLNRDLIDYIAMDIKGSRENYGKVTGVEEIDLSRLEESIGMITSNKIPYEFRTTLAKGLHTKDDVLQMAKWIAGCKNYYLQSYRFDENVMTPIFAPFLMEEMEEFREIARKYIDKVVVRGVE